MIQRLWLPLVFSLAMIVGRPAFADDPKPALQNPELAAADQLYKSGKFAAAVEKYQAALTLDPKLVPAQAGLVRALLREWKLDDALAAATRALAGQPNSSPLLAAMGDVQFRRAEMADAELTYLKALKIDPREVQAYLGLVRLYQAYSAYRHAYDALQQAHKIAPDDPEVQRAWLRELPRKERIAALEAYLAGPHPDTASETDSLESYLAFLKATAEQPVHGCKLVSKVEQTETKLDGMMRDPRHVSGYTVGVKLNDRNVRLLLDTGASGIVIRQKTAEKAGLTRISSIKFAGIGDKGAQNGYLALADHIRIGELEFADCVVVVSERAWLSEEEGLIGADVFRSYLIDIDMPDRKLRLTPLPKPPDEAAVPTALETDEEADSGDEAEGLKGQPSEGAKSPAPAAVQRLPRDRYVAPEMKQWTRAFHFGHSLLVPTRVNDSPPMLFLIDTGSTTNVLSRRAASQVTKVSSDPYTYARGISGRTDVYRAQNATLIFGHYVRNNQEGSYAFKKQDMITLDLTDMSRRFGTDISGMLGFDLLQVLQIKIDYRDGLVDFVYDVKRFGSGR